MNITDLTPENLRSKYLCIDHFNAKYIIDENGQRRHVKKTAIPEIYQTPDPQNTSSSPADDIGIVLIVDSETVPYEDITIGDVEVMNTYIENSPVNTITQQNVGENQSNWQNAGAHDICIDTDIVEPETIKFDDLTIGSVEVVNTYSPVNTITEQDVGENQSNDQIVAKYESNRIKKVNCKNGQKLRKIKPKVNFRILAKLIKSNIEEKIKNKDLQFIVNNNSDIASNSEKDPKPRALNPALSEFLKFNDKEDTSKCMEQSKSLDDKLTISRLELVKEWLKEPKATLTQQNQRLFKYVTSKINLNEIEESEFHVKIFVVYISYQISELLAKCRGNQYVFYDKNTDWLNSSPKKFTLKTSPTSNIKEDSPHQVKSHFSSQQVVLETNDDLFKFIKSSDPPFKPEPLYNLLSSLTELTDEHKNKLMDFCKRYACDAHFKWMTANGDDCKFLTKFEYWLQLKPRFPGFIPALLKEHYPSVTQDPKTNLGPLEQALLRCTDVPKDLTKVIHRFVHHPEDSERITAYISKFECNCKSESCDTQSIKLEDEGLESDPLALDGDHLPFEVTNPTQTRDRIEDVSQVMQKLKCLSESTKIVEPSKLEFGPVLDQLVITKKPLPVKTGTKVFLPGSKIGMVAKVSNIKDGTVIVPISKLRKGVKVKKSNVYSYNSVKNTATIRSNDDASDEEETGVTASTSNDKHSEETQSYPEPNVYGPASHISKTMPKTDNLLKTQDTITVVKKLPAMPIRPTIDITSALTGQSSFLKLVTNSTNVTASVLSILNDKKRLSELASSCKLYNEKLKSSKNIKTNADSARAKSSKLLGPIILNKSLVGKSIPTLARTPETSAMAIEMTSKVKSKKTNGKVPLILKKSIAVKQLLSDIDSGHFQKEKSPKINSVTNTELVNMSLNEFRKRVYTPSSLDRKSETPFKKELTEIDQLLENALKKKITSNFR